MKLKVGKLKFWQMALAVVLVYWALVLFGVFDFGGADKILAVGALITAALIIFDKQHGRAPLGRGRNRPE